MQQQLLQRSVNESFGRLCWFLGSRAPSVLVENEADIMTSRYRELIETGGCLDLDFAAAGREYLRGQHAGEWVDPNE